MVSEEVFVNCYNFNLIRVKKYLYEVKKGNLINFQGILEILCPSAVYYLRYVVMSFFTMSRTSLSDGKRSGQKVQRKIAVAVQNVKPLYFLSRSFPQKSAELFYMFL